ncbi:hypothetical protein LG200_01950 [Methylobacillus caricis]|uniref:hypothetical protein n=1 Tax=Methylobacillus caricis TaxID=1971611 RepID=UPI001CFFAF23|nr:hypothetical protein [Methylobacillus caricis]MCB5186764.1 hypothetical protein [Methylobacillus caricis]
MSVSIFDQIVVDKEVHFKALQDGVTYNGVVSAPVLQKWAQLTEVEIIEDLKKLEVFQQFEQEIGSAIEKIIHSGKQGVNNNTILIGPNDL